MIDGLTPEQRLSWVRTLVAQEPTSSDGAQGTAAVLGQVCRSLTRAVHLSGAAISLMNEGGPAGIVAGTGDDWKRIEELPFILGEGPCWDAYESRQPVLVRDVGSHDETRWPGYSVAALENGVRAVYAFPLKVGLARLGVLNLYRKEPGDLTTGDLALAHAFADLATSLLIDGQEEAGAGAVPSGVDRALGSRFEVYQAQGMVMIQSGVTLPDAMARLRAHAYAHDRTLGQVARDVVGRLLVFEPDHLDPGLEKGSGT